MTVISYSEVRCGQTCMRQYYYRYGLGLVPLARSEAIDKGVDGHLMLKNFYTAIQEGCTVEEAKNRMSDNFQEITPETLVALKLVYKYIDNLDMSELQGVSVSIDTPYKLKISDNLTIGFTPDFLFYYKGKRLTLRDYKFIGRAWSKRRMDKYVQLNLYQAFLKKLGYTVTRSELVFLNITTEVITKKRYTPSALKLENTFNEFLTVAADLCEFKGLPVAAQSRLALRTVNETICQWCKYDRPCELELEGKDASKTLLNEYTSDDYGYQE